MSHLTITPILKLNSTPENKAFTRISVFTEDIQCIINYLVRDTLTTNTHFKNIQFPSKYSSKGLEAYLKVPQTIFKLD